jgi:hypothetical protein
MPAKTIIKNDRFYIPLSVLYKSIIGWDCSWIMLNNDYADDLYEAVLPAWHVEVDHLIDLGGDE